MREFKIALVPGDGVGPEVVHAARRAILSGAMMAEYLGVPAVSASIRNSVCNVLAQGSVKTRDLGGSATTAEMTQAIIDAMLEED